MSFCYVLFLLLFTKVIILSVQCYAWTEYKFTCLSVRHTSYQLAYTGQTPQRIITVGSLKDADLRKDVPFRGLDDE